MKKLWNEIELIIFVPIAAIMIIAVLFGVFAQDAFAEFSTNLLNAVCINFKSPILLCSLLALFFAIVFCFTPFSKRIIGGPDQKPAMGTFSYICVITTGSIGSTILFWGVAEPMYHWTSPPTELGLESMSAAAAAAGISIANIHWAVLYFCCIVLWSIGMGHMCVDKGLPFRPSSALWPLLKDKIFSWPGKLVDIICLLCLVGGMVPSFGLGVTQIAAGIEYQFGLPQSTVVYVIILLVIAAGFTTSSSLGIKKGIQKIADLNGYFYIGLCAFLFIAGPTVFLSNLGLSSLSEMFTKIVPLLTNGDAFGIDNNWSSSYTTSYMIWSCIYTPVTSMFFISISKGRSYRQMALMTLIPTNIFCQLLFLLFGGNAIYMQSNGVDILGKISEFGVPSSAYILLENFGIGAVAGPIIIFTLLISFITMADNMTFSMAQLTSKNLGKDYVPRLPLRIFWAALICGMTLVSLLAMGKIGLSSMQSVAASIGLPFYIVLVLLLICVIRIISGKAEKDFDCMHAESPLTEPTDD